MIPSPLYDHGQKPPVPVRPALVSPIDGLSRREDGMIFVEHQGRSFGKELPHVADRDM